MFSVWLAHLNALGPGCLEAAFGIQCETQNDPPDINKHEKETLFVPDTVPNIWKNLHLLSSSIRIVDRPFSDLDSHKHDKYLIYEPG